MKNKMVKKRFNCRYCGKEKTEKSWPAPSSDPLPHCRAAGSKRWCNTCRYKAKHLQSPTAEAIAMSEPFHDVLAEGEKEEVVVQPRPKVTLKKRKDEASANFK